MNLLDVCSGIGGFSLAMKHLVGGFRTVGYVEIDRYCREVLRARIRDGILDDAPIFHDVRDGALGAYRGKVDLLTAGFPCPKFSSARRGQGSPHDLWFDVYELVKRTEPLAVFLENVQLKPIALAARDLRLCGYNVLYVRADAAAMGAPFIRERWFLAAQSDSNSEPGFTLNDEVAFVPSVGSDIWKDHTEAMGLDDGTSSRLDRLRAAGNAVIPAVVAKAWNTLTGRESE